MREPEGDALPRLWWAMRRYASILVLTTIGTAGTAALVSPGPAPDVYHASALVVANELEGVRAEHLPRMAQAVYTGNNVPAQAVRIGDLPHDAEELTEEHSWVEVVEGTVVIRVKGAAQDGELAARIANAGAQALTAELNRMGPGVGSFSLHETASAPHEPEPGSLDIPPSLLGVLAGLVLGAGLVGLTLTLRRPVWRLREALEIVEAPLLGVVELSRGGHFDPPHEVEGAGALAEKIYPRRREVGALTSAQRPTERSQIAVLLARTLTEDGPACFVPSPDRPGRRAEEAVCHITGVVSFEEARSRLAQTSPTPTKPLPVVVDGPPSRQMGVPATHSPILVVRDGIPTTQLVNAAEHLRPQGIAGVVWVTSRGGPLHGWLRRLMSGLRRGNHLATTPDAKVEPDPPNGDALSSGSDQAEETRPPGEAPLADPLPGRPASRVEDGSHDAPGGQEPLERIRTRP